MRNPSASSHFNPHGEMKKTRNICQKAGKSLQQTVTLTAITGSVVVRWDAVIFWFQS